MSGFLSPIGMITQILSDQGVVGDGYQIYTYVGGSVDTPVTTFTSSTLIVPNSNPIILGPNGRFQNVCVWAPAGTIIKMVITDANNNPIIGGTIDNIPLINDVAGSIGYFNLNSAEIAAGIIPVNFGYPALYPDRYETNTTPGQTDMTYGIQTALSLAATQGVTGNAGTCVQLLATTYLISSTLVIQQGVTLRGAGGSGVGSGQTVGTGTNILANVTGVAVPAIQLGNSSTTQSYKPALYDLSITLLNNSTVCVKVLCAVSAMVQNVFGFNGATSTNQALIGILISGGTAASAESTFFNTFVGCEFENFHVAVSFNSGSSSTPSTANYFIGVTGSGLLGATPNSDITGYAVEFAQPNEGLGSVFTGGYFENFATGVYFNATEGVLFLGTQFEGCGISPYSSRADVQWSGSDVYCGFYGLPDLSTFSQNGVMANSCVLDEAGFVNGVLKSVSGSFTASFFENAGAGALGTGTAYYRIANGVCTLTLPAVTHASAYDDLTITGLPAVCQPSRSVNSNAILVENNSLPNSIGVAQFANASGTITMLVATSSSVTGTNWTTSNNKGLYTAQTVTYPLS